MTPPEPGDNRVGGFQLPASPPAAGPPSVTSTRSAQSIAAPADDVHPPTSEPAENGHVESAQTEVLDRTRRLHQRGCDEGAAEEQGPVPR